MALNIRVLDENGEEIELSELMEDDSPSFATIDEVEEAVDHILSSDEDVTDESSDDLPEDDEDYDPESDDMFEDYSDSMGDDDFDEDN